VDTVDDQRKLCPRIRGRREATAQPPQVAVK